MSEKEIEFFILYIILKGGRGEIHVGDMAKMAS